MIKKVHIKNFKSVSDIEIDFKQLNVLVGKNSSGKSTIIQSILFAAQNARADVGFNGGLIKAGNYEDIKCRYISDKDVLSELEDDKGNIISIVVDSRYGDVKKIIKGQVSDIEKEFDYEKRELSYLSCKRLGPAELYEKNMSLNDTLGINGEYTMGYLNAHAQDRLGDELCKTKSVYTLLGQVNWWLKYIIEAEISTEEIPGANKILATYSMRDISRISPINVGAGISYLISILVMCLSAPEDGIIIIENPEIHLHPSAQSKICEFLLFIARGGRQVFVESHSDHIFNGFRAEMAMGDVDDRQIAIDFFYLGDDNLSYYERVKIGKRGRIENQRPDLFDQFNLDLDRMLGL